MQDKPQLLSIAVMVRADRKALFVRHARGPFGGRWSLPLAGVAEHETAEDAIERLMRDLLHVTPGPYEFLDTVYLTGGGGERFIANGFTCVDWQGEPRFPPEVFDDALWAPPADIAGLDLLPEMRDWLSTLFAGDSGAPAAVEYDPASLLALLSDARGELLAAFDAIPTALRAAPLDEGGWSAFDVLAHAADVEAYYWSEVVRCLDEPGRLWGVFNDVQWYEGHRLRPVEDEGALRGRLEVVRADARTWLMYKPPESLAAYFNHPTRGVVQAGERVEQIAIHDREHAGQLREMARAAALQAAADGTSEAEDRP
ncbi:MAG: DinB family protein [Dehalococcoidia bacterium]